MTILNFAHGEFLMLACTWLLVLRALGNPPYVAVFGVFFAIFIFGVIVQSGLIQRMLGTQLLRQILLLLGISMLMTGWQCSSGSLIRANCKLRGHPTR